MIFYISLSDAQSITQQQSLRSVARELSLRYPILHYDEANFICSGDKPDDGIELPNDLWLVKAGYPNAVFTSQSFALALNPPLGNHAIKLDRRIKFI